MPELPEVETISKDLNKTVLLKTIQHVVVNDKFIIKGIAPKAFEQRLTGAQISAVYRRGKALVFVLSPSLYWVVQPMMTGQLVYSYPQEKPTLLKETRLEVKLSDGGYIVYNDQRRFGHVRLVSDLSAVNYFNILGPEPLTSQFNAAYLTHRLAASNRPIKNILLDHTVVAGIGNIYAAEILFRAKVHPARLGRLVTPKEMAALIKYTQEVLKEAILNRGSSMRNYRDGRGEKGRFNALIRVYAREHEPCVVCKEPILRIVQSGRSTFFCRTCQQ